MKNPIWEVAHEDGKVGVYTYGFIAIEIPDNTANTKRCNRLAELLNKNAQEHPELYPEDVTAEDE